jgi:hypothetical protein
MTPDAATAKDRILMSGRNAEGKLHPYDRKAGVDAGRPWNALNPEQQAHLIEDAWVLGQFNTPPDPLSAGDAKYATVFQTAIAHVHAPPGNDIYRCFRQ